VSSPLLPVILLVADVIRRYQMPGSVVTIVVSGCHFPCWPRRLSKRALSSDRKRKVEGCPAVVKVRDVPWSTGSQMESRIPLQFLCFVFQASSRVLLLDEIRARFISYFALPRRVCELSGREWHRAFSENEDLARIPFLAERGRRREKGK